MIELFAVLQILAVAVAVASSVGIIVFFTLFLWKIYLSGEIIARPDMAYIVLDYRRRKYQVRPGDSFWGLPFRRRIMQMSLSPVKIQEIFTVKASDYFDLQISAVVRVYPNDEVVESFFRTGIPLMEYEIREKVVATVQQYLENEASRSTIEEILGNRAAFGESVKEMCETDFANYQLGTSHFTLALKDAGPISGIYQERKVNAARYASQGLDQQIERLRYDLEFQRERGRFAFDAEKQRILSDLEIKKAQSLATIEQGNILSSPKFIEMMVAIVALENEAGTQKAVLDSINNVIGSLNTSGFLGHRDPLTALSAIIQQFFPDRFKTFEATYKDQDSGKE